MNVNNKRGEISNFLGLVLVLLIVAAASGAYMMFRSHQNKMKAIAAEQARLQKEREEAARALQEKQRVEELAKREAERKAKEEKRQAELAARREKEAREARVREEAEAAKVAAENRYRDANERVRGVSMDYFANAKASEKPKTVTVKTTFLCLTPDYADTRNIYEVVAEPGKEMQITMLSADSEHRSVSVEDFKATLLGRPYFLVLGGKAFLCSKNLGKREFAAPQRGEPICLAVQELDTLYQTAISARIELPQQRFKVALRTKDGRKTIPIKTAGYSEKTTIDEVLSIAKTELEKLFVANAARIAANTKIKVKKYKRTVVLYDGTIIKKDISGVTYVPLEFNFHGTTVRRMRDYKSEANARAEWERLKAEAERQEREATEYEARQESHQKEAIARRADEMSTVYSSDVRQALDGCTVIFTPISSE